MSLKALLDEVFDPTLSSLYSSISIAFHYPLA